jgi:hypothetical protein
LFQETVYPGDLSVRSSFYTFYNIGRQRQLKNYTAVKKPKSADNSKFVPKNPPKEVSFAKGPPKPVKTGFLEGTRDYYDLVIVGAGVSRGVRGHFLNEF